MTKNTETLIIGICIGLVIGLTAGMIGIQIVSNIGLELILK
jgi:hypothetical protein